MVSSKGVVCNSKKSRFIKEQEASRLLSQLGIRTLLMHQIRTTAMMILMIFMRI